MRKGRSILFSLAGLGFTLLSFESFQSPNGTPASLDLQFSAVCPSGQSCFYKGLNIENETVGMNCTAGNPMQVNWTNYFTDSGHESCNSYVGCQCDGTSSCQVVFDNQNCGGDPEVNVVKSGSAAIRCADNVRYTGRFGFAPASQPMADLGGGEILFGFNGTSLGIELSVLNNPSMGGESYYHVQIDDEPLKRIMVKMSSSQTSTKINLVSSLANGYHRVKFIRDDEGSISGASQLLNIDYGQGAPANLIIPTNPTIEILGDSYSNGLGTYGCLFGLETEDVTVSWGFLASHALGAEYRNVALSGARSVDISGVYQYAVTNFNGDTYDFNQQRPPMRLQFC